MTRQDILKQFPTATEDQITAFLNMHNSELSAEKAKNKAGAENEETIKNLREQIEALQNKDLSETDKMQKQIDELTAQNQKATATIRNMEMKADLLGKGISAEDADKFIEGIKADKFDAGILETMINNAIASREAEAMKNTPNPTGAVGGGKGEDAVEKLVKDMYSSDAKPQNIVSNYIN